ncbi:MAG: class I SAM-dependent methyltransferase [Candidatus Thorarchaeota archaeon]
MSGRNTAEQWETNAAAYADLIGGKGTPHHQHILNPCVEKMLGEIAGKRVLDAGCGEGYLSRYYSRKGALVTGVDISRRFISIAASIARNEGVSVEFRQSDLCNLSGIPDGYFDVVLCNLVLMNVPCLDEALASIRRVLRQSGILVLSVVHPAFDFYGPGRWELGDKDTVTGRRTGKHFIMDNYLDETVHERVWKSRDGSDFPAPITFFHRPISRYVSALIRAGFSLEALEEPVPDSTDDFFERERRIPTFLVIKSRRV